MEIIFLKSISSYFELRKRSLEKKQSSESKIKLELQSFFSARFGGDLKGISLVINYMPAEKALTITTPNKIIASEMTLHLADLTEFLKNKEIKLNRILIW